MADGTLETVLRRDRIVVAAALAGLAALAWAYVLWLAADMDMGGMDMSDFRMIPAGMGMVAPALAPWGGIEFAFVFAMWAVMMVGMMTPSAAPMILIYARLGRQRAIADKPFTATSGFATGYLLAWVGFALTATVAQWALDRATLLDPMMASSSKVLGGGVLIAACGLLLGSHGTAVRWRRDERALDRASRAARSFGEDPSARALDCTSRRRYVSYRGSLAAIHRNGVTDTPARILASGGARYQEQQGASASRCRQR